MQYSEKSINEAKERVREMQKRAKRYTQSEPAADAPDFSPPVQETHNSDDASSSVLLLAILILLRQEGADNILLLAVLYLLL